MLRIFFGLLIISVFSGCGSRELKVPIQPTYQSIQAITISQKCLFCHSSLSTYDGLKAIVTPYNVSQSDLYRVVNEGSMPQWSPKLSDAEISAISQWINSGAQND